MTRQTVLIFAGLDPSGGAGIAADILAVAAQGAHALPIVTTLTVQDNEHVFDALAVASEILARQAQALIDRIGIDAVKIGIPGSRANAQVIADVILRLRRRHPQLPVVLDPVLASGHGDALSREDALQILAPLLPLTTLIVPNLPEAAALQILAPLLPLTTLIVPNLPEVGALCGAARTLIELTLEQQAQHLQALGCQHVLVSGGHGSGDTVHNRWFGPGTDEARHEWRWPRLPGEFHGSGCTLAAAIAARLAQGEPMASALDQAQAYCHRALAASYAIAPGQRMPLR